MIARTIATIAIITITAITTKATAAAPIPIMAFFLPDPFFSGLVSVFASSFTSLAGASSFVSFEGVSSAAFSSALASSFASSTGASSFASSFTSSAGVSSFASSFASSAGASSFASSAGASALTSSAVSSVYSASDSAVTISFSFSIRSPFTIYKIIQQIYFNISYCMAQHNLLTISLLQVKGSGKVLFRPHRPRHKCSSHHQASYKRISILFRRQYITYNRYSLQHLPRILGLFF